MVTLHISSGSSPDSPGRRKCYARSIVRSLVQAGLIWLAGAGGALAQSQSEGTSPKPTSSAISTPVPRILTGDAAKHVEAMEKSVIELESKGQFAEAATKVREILAIRARAQGNDHWETSD